MLYFRHFAGLIGFAAAYSAFSDFILEHRVVGGTSTPELLAGKEVAYIDQQEGKAEDAEYNG